MYKFTRGQGNSQTITILMSGCVSIAGHSGRLCFSKDHGSKLQMALLSCNMLRL